MPPLLSSLLIIISIQATTTTTTMTPVSLRIPVTIGLMLLADVEVEGVAGDLKFGLDTGSTTTWIRSEYLPVEHFARCGGRFSCSYTTSVAEGETTEVRLRISGLPGWTEVVGVNENAPRVSGLIGLSDRPTSTLASKWQFGSFTILPDQRTVLDCKSPRGYEMEETHGTMLVNLFNFSRCRGPIIQFPANERWETTLNRFSLKPFRGNKISFKNLRVVWDTGVTCTAIQPQIADAIESALASNLDAEFVTIHIGNHQYGTSVTKRLLAIGHNRGFFRELSDTLAIDMIIGMDLMRLLQINFQRTPERQISMCALNS